MPKAIPNMLVLSRKVGDEIAISNSVTVKVLAIDGNKVSIGIEAPRCILVRRKEQLSAPVRQVDRPIPVRRRRELAEV